MGKSDTLFFKNSFRDSQTNINYYFKTTLYIFSLSDSILKIT